MRGLSAVIILMLTIIGGKSYAQLTGLDTTFNHTGSVVHNGFTYTGYSDIQPKDFIVQPDGSIITVTSDDGSYEAFFVRIKPDGQIDSSFQRFQAPIYGVNETAFRLHSLSDGRFLMFAKATDDSGVLYRFWPDGSLDGSIGWGGRRKYGFSHPNYWMYTPECLAIQPDGKIIMSSNFWGVPRLLRVEANGKIDSSFGNYGFANLQPIAGPGFKVTKILFQSGRILCTGANTMPSEDRYGVQAFKYDGTPDSSFGTNGITIVPIGFRAYIRGSGLQKDGKIILGGSSGSGYSNDVALVRLHANGVIDSSFGTAGDGIVKADLDNSWDEVGGVDVDSNDVIWATAERYNPHDISRPLFEPTLVRFTPHGKVDSMYKTNGRIPFRLTSDHVNYWNTRIVKNKLHVFGNGYWNGNRCEYVARLYLRPFFNEEEDMVRCAYDTASIICNSALPHTWYRNDTALAYTGDTLRTAVSGSYMVVLTDGAASDSSMRINLTVKPPVSKPVLTGLTTLCEGDALNLSISSATTDAIWKVTTPKISYTDTVGIKINSVGLSDTGVYRVVALKDDCESAEASVHVHIDSAVAPGIALVTDKGPNIGPWVEVLFSATSVVNPGDNPLWRWTKNGANIAGATDSVHKMTGLIDFMAGDTVCVRMRSSALCARPDSISDCVVMNMDMAVADPGTSSILKIYPNPSAGKLTIDAPSKGTLYVNDVTGKEVARFTVKEGHNYVVLPAGITNGAYLLQLRCHDYAYNAKLEVAR